MPALDGLRGIAILLVLLYHTLGRLPAFSFFRIGWCGVDLFFVLSGFLITGILLDSKDSASYYPNFFIRRAFRIFPLYYLSFSILVAGFFLSHSLYDHPEWLLGKAGWFLSYTQNFLFAFHENPNPVFRHTWSLAIEEQFYLAWPWAVFFIPFKSLKRLLPLLIVMVAVLRTYYLHLHPGTAAFYLSFFRVDALFAGAWVQLLLRDAQLNRSGIRILLVAMLLLLAASFLLFNGFPDYFDPRILGPGLTVLAAFFAVCLVAVLQEGFLLRRFCEQPWLGYTGRRSYALYLFHYPLLCILEPRQLPLISQQQNGAWSLPAYLTAFAIILLLSFVLAELSFRLLEKPLLAYRDRKFPAVGRAAKNPTFDTQA